MMYSHDGFGLGHLRRNLNIASRFTREVPGASVLMLVGSPSAELLELPEGVDILKLPSIVKVGTNDWRPRRLQLSSESARDLRSRLILRAAESLCPDLLLVDHLPTGVWGELMPTLRMFRRLATPPHVILGLRDILDDPLKVRESWSRSGVYEVISELYDEVFIYGRPEVYDTARHYGLDVLDDSTVRYCGYVYSEQEPANAEQVRRELAPDGQRLVLVTGGGGQDAFPMMQASLDALSCLNPAERPRMALITGPLMDADKREILSARARELSAHVLGCVSNSIDYLAAADVVVTMAGYNTVQEALRLGKRVVVIPRRGPSAEQRIRSVNLTRLGLVTFIDPDTLRARDIARALTARSKAPPGPVTALGGNGVTDAVAAMRARLAGRSRSRPTPLPGRGIYLPEVAAC
jgi:predicted glycosyltransferase